MVHCHVGLYRHYRLRLLLSIAFCGVVFALPARRIACPFDLLGGACSRVGFNNHQTKGHKMNSKDRVCSEIQKIMETYREQEACGRVDTPGGLEHMGDVWRLLRKWDEDLSDNIKRVDKQ